MTQNESVPVLYMQWCKIIKNILKIKGVDNLDDIAIGAMPMYFQEYIFRTFQDEVKHKVYLSKHLQNNPKYSEFKEVIIDIKNKAENGQDLTCYLSRGIIKNLKEPDRLLNDWGVVHLHLSNDIENDGFCKRTNELLFVYRNFTNPTDLYFLDIFEHGRWSEKIILETIYKNWPLLLEPFKVDCIDISYSPTDNDVKSLRSANINTAIKLDDGSVYMVAGGGMTMAGTNIHSILKQNECLRFFTNIEKEIVNNFKVPAEALSLVLEDKKLVIKIRDQKIEHIKTPYDNIFRQL